MKTGLVFGGQVKVKNELPDFMLTDLDYICASSFGNEENLKVADATGYNDNGVRTFALGGSTKPVTMK